MRLVPLLYLVSRLHDHLNIQVLRGHGQQLVIVVSYIPCITCDALKFLEGGGLLGLAWGGGRRLVACFNQARKKQGQLTGLK